MAKKYTYSRTLSSFEGIETFEAVEFDSFDEAKKVVDKAIYERRLELKANTPMGLGTVGTVPHLIPGGKTLPNGPISGDNKGNASPNIQGSVAGSKVLNK